jgi:tetratricopeptide (TPR) repeat protein
MAASGGYQMGFTITPLTHGGGLDTSGDFAGGPHPAEEDTLYKMACENRDGGNKMVKDGQYENAIARYSELIMQLRALGEEKDVLWDDKGTEAVRQLRAAAYLNLSLCFLKTQQWQHALNTATRALQGDKDPPVPEENVLAPEKKAKALFRRAQAHSEGFSDPDKAKADLEKAVEYAPEDKSLQQELRRVSQILSKKTKEADKKMAGFFANSKKVQSGDGLFEEKLRPSNEGNEPKLTDIKKLSDGLWLAPKDDTQQEAEEIAGEEGIDFNELSREINEMREDRPEVYQELRQKIEAHLKEAAAEKDGEVPKAVAAAA